MPSNVAGIRRSLAPTKTNHIVMPRFTRHKEVLVLDRYADSVAARYFNIAQTALKRSRDPIRLRIPTLNHLDLLVQDDAWIIVDRVLYDMPVVAWTDFAHEGRDNLHEPIPCEVCLYHFAARMVLKTTLDAMHTLLGESLLERIQQQEEKVLTLKQDAPS